MARISLMSLGTAAKLRKTGEVSCVIQSCNSNKWHPVDKVLADYLGANSHPDYTNIMKFKNNQITVKDYEIDYIQRLNKLDENKIKNLFQKIKEWKNDNTLVTLSCHCRGSVYCHCRGSVYCHNRTLSRYLYKHYGIYISEPSVIM